MNTLTYGMQIPVSGDRGSVFYPGLAANFTQLDAHNHNGTNSPKITSLALTGTTQAISSASWVLTSGGLYRQAVTVPAGIVYDSYWVKFRDASTGHQYELTCEKISSSQYYVYINDNTVNLTAFYGI
jgi:hypothetical protein